MSYEEGAIFAKENNLMFIELSAKTGKNLDELVKHTAKIIFDKINIGLIDVSDEVSYFKNNIIDLSQFVLSFLVVK